MKSGAVVATQTPVAGTNRPRKIPDIDLCICSYHRPEIVETLGAVSRQIGVPPGRVRVIVADNTAHGEGREVVRLASEELHLDLHYVHAPANNISVARNACLDAARSEWIVFLDDDELPALNWLAALLEEARRGDWDAVLGPVAAVYADSAPSWLSRGRFHSTGPVWVRGEIVTAYTGNVLFRRDFAQSRSLRFRPDLGKTGGEDEDFFYRFRDGGGRIGFAPDAVCYEHVAPHRANIGWLMRRSFRAGQSHGWRLGQRMNKPVGMLIASAKAAYCGIGAAIHIRDAVLRNRYLMRAALHWGVVARLAGMREIKMY